MAIDRASADDLAQLAADAGSVPNLAAGVFLLDPDGPFDLEEARATLASRIGAVPRLRQRLVRLPVGYGRPVWVDVRRVDVSDHVQLVGCPPPGDERALLDVVADLVTTDLPRERPLWAVTFVTGLAGGQVAMVVRFHHVLADGLGGLNVLAHLVDGGPQHPDPEPPRAPPTARELRLDARAARRAVLRRWRELPGALAAVRSELTGARPLTAPRTTLNRPTGPRRRLALARTDLAAVRRVAHAHGATVNDVLLATVAGALRTLLEHRGEPIDRVVASIPVSGRGRGDDQLGNHVGIAPVDLPVAGDLDTRIDGVVAATRARVAAARGAPATVLGPALRLLAASGLFRWFTDHQRVVNTFVTNVPGPDTVLSFAGHPIVGAFASGLATGNVPVAFAVLSYAGTITITTVADPQVVPDLDVLRVALRTELDRLVADPGRSSADVERSAAPSGAR